MIIIKNLIWSNWFSYGKNNYIDFEQPVLQITGKNGTGKTSIPLILQEVFYGKNSKGKKKASLINRYLEKPILEAECNFSDGLKNEYKIKLTRKSSLKLSLFKNGKDISSHTTTNTYKTIQSIIGLDFKTFAQLIYQSSTDNLEFLTATDSNRKKFLITLFSLNKYLNIQEQFKLVSSELYNELTGINSKISTIESWIKKHKNTNFTKEELKSLPELDNESVERLGKLQASLTSIATTNKKINRNNQYKELLKKLDITILYDNSEIPKEVDKKEINDEYTTGKKRKIEIDTLIKKDVDKKDQIASLGSTCITCNQPIEGSIKELQIQLLQDSINNLEEEKMILDDKITRLMDHLKEINTIEKRIKKKEEVANEVAKLTNYIDKTLPNEILNQQEIKEEINSISSKLIKIKDEIVKISEENSRASAHNSKIDVILEQLRNHKEEVVKSKIETTTLNDTFNKVEIIKKAFGPSGLLSYKIDFLVKDLEKEINEYLSILSSGKFQLIFKLENEKLNIEIIDEGFTVSIEELSAGELARINAATLLAIRKLMAAISSTKINILFLDEIMGVLDESGKEVLIEVLHEETDLNTLLVSHDYSHPLIPRITIVKENKISRIENG